MYEARIFCSGAECDEEIEVFVEDLRELDRFACECGYGFVVLSISEVELDRPAEVTRLIRCGDEHWPLAA